MDFIKMLNLISDILHKVHVMIKREAGNNWWSKSLLFMLLEHQFEWEATLKLKLSM